MLDRETRTILFGRFSYEDVRLYNLESLVVRPILEPDNKVRLAQSVLRLCATRANDANVACCARLVEDDERRGDRARFAVTTRSMRRAVVF